MNTLYELLDRNLEHPAEYGSALSNHLPMALHALQQLGADDARLDAFFAGYAKRFEGLKPAECAEPLDDWHQGIGRIEAFDRLRASFVALLGKHGVDATLSAVLPDLWPGVAAAAFHGLIRTAHAAQAGNAGELAAGLAYWAARWEGVPEGLSGEAPLAFSDWSARLETTATGLRSNADLISARIEAVARTGEYAGLASSLHIEPILLAQASDWAASLYARSGNFTVLHLVTGLRAARVLWPWVEDPAFAAMSLVRAVAAAVLASNLTLGEVEAPILSWGALRAAAIDSDDEHVVKLVHACVENTAVYGEGARRSAASRALV